MIGTVLGGALATGLPFLKKAMPGIISGASSLFGLNQAKRQRGFQREMADTQYQRDVEMWNRMNEYNTPENQRKRLEEANLNPALMYKSMPQNVATQMPKTQKYDTPVAQWNPLNGIQMLSGYQDVKIKKGQEESIKQDVVRKKLENTYLGKQLNLDVNSKSLQYAFEQILKGAMFSQDKKGNWIVHADPESTMMKKYIGEVEGRELDNELRKMDLDFYKGLPKGAQKGIGYLMQLISLMK